MKTITLEEAQRDLRRYVDAAANGEPILIAEGANPLARIVAPAETSDAEGWEDHMRALEARGSIIRANPNASRKLRRRVEEGTDTATTDWLLGEGREDRA